MVCRTKQKQDIRNEGVHYVLRTLSIGFCQNNCQKTVCLPFLALTSFPAPCPMSQEIVKNNLKGFIGKWKY